ncbi:hypothetical protein [Streptomyces laurentii]|uniref:hypothetical protein n=1 Tax=Streptomyces laurentii TaxID=39478 RepID=UPI0036904B32
MDPAQPHPPATRSPEPAARIAAWPARDRLEATAAGLRRLLVALDRDGDGEEEAFAPGADACLICKAAANGRTWSQARHDAPSARKYERILAAHPRHPPAGAADDRSFSPTMRRVRPLLETENHRAGGRYRR